MKRSLRSARGIVEREGLNGGQSNRNHNTKEASQVSFP
jgi:hypothetical protein